MTKRGFAVLWVAAALFSLLPESLPAKELEVPYHSQGTEVWCWSAVVRMVGEHLTGLSTSDCELLSRYNHALGGQGDCCASPDRCLRRGTSGEIKYLLANLYGIRGQHHARPISFSRLVEEIERDQPVIIALTSGNLGHVVAAVGYELPDKIILLDPLSGRQVVAYEALQQNGSAGKWTETFTVRNQRSGAATANASFNSPFKKRSLPAVNEHFEPNFDAESASAVVFQRAVKGTLKN